jgi:hypothetical protein
MFFYGIRKIYSDKFLLVINSLNFILKFCEETAFEGRSFPSPLLYMYAFCPLSIHYMKQINQGQVKVFSSIILTVCYK